MMDLSVKQLLEGSLNNAVVARQLGLTRERVRQLREEAHMPSVRQARYIKIAGLLRDGRTPKEIAAMLGVRNVRSTIDLMRKRGLVDQKGGEKAARSQEQHQASRAKGDGEK